MLFVEIAPPEPLECLRIFSLQRSARCVLPVSHLQLDRVSVHVRVCAIDVAFPLVRVYVT